MNAKKERNDTNTSKHFKYIDMDTKKINKIVDKKFARFTRKNRRRVKP